METVVFIIGIMLLWILIGSFVLSFADINNLFYNWYAKDPTGGIASFIILLLWPVIVGFMLKYRKDNEE